MKYISVIGTDSSALRTQHIFKHFDTYLISIGDPTTKPSWTMKSILEHGNKIVQNNKKLKETLYIDSGGFQIIQGYIGPDRIIEFIDSYHFFLERNMNDIDKIFSLDVNNFEMSSEQIYYFNQYSVQESKKLIDKYPQLKDKQLFVLQTRNHKVFQIWKTLFEKEELYKYYKHWSFGGLVNLKKETNAKFSHVVPATCWLLTYQKKYNFEIETLHYLGQGSRINFLSAYILEREFDINITCDSSQLVRFAKPMDKLPIIYIDPEKVKLINNGEFDTIKGSDFELVTKDNLGDLSKVFKESSLQYDPIDIIENYENGGNELNTMDMNIPPHLKKLISENELKQDFSFQKTTLEYSEEFEPLNIVKNVVDYNAMNNENQLEMQSVNIINDIAFAKFFYHVNKDRIFNMTMQDIKDFHPILNRGRIAMELFNNILFIKQFKPIIESANTGVADAYMYSILNSYIK